MGQVKHGSLDDYFMSSVLTGAYGGEYDVHMYFVNAAYGYFLKPFYWLFPEVGWYFIFELIGTFAAFTAYTYVLIKKMGLRCGIPLSLLMLASLTPDFYFQLSFTQCATAYTAAGILLFSVGLSKENRWLLVLGGLGLLAGSFMRWEGFLLGMPYLCYLLVLVWLEKRSFEKKSVVVLGMIFVAIVGLHYYDRSLYTEGEYKQYADYQPVRAIFSDGAYYDRESTFDELEERGKFGHDFNLLKSWMFYDTDVFCKDSLTSFVDVVSNNLYEPNLIRLPVAICCAVSKTLTRTSGWCWVLLCFLLILSGSKRAAFFPWASLGIIAGSIGYLLLVNRLVYHVESGIWLYAIVLAIPFLDVSSLNNKLSCLKLDKLLWVSFILVSVFFATIGITNQSSLKEEVSLIGTVQTPQKWKGFLEFAKKNQNKVFIFSFAKYKELGKVRNPPYLAIEPGSWNNIFSWGYWNIYLPAMKKELAKRGVENPIRDIVHDNVYVMENNHGSNLHLFYEEHYHKSLIIDTVKKFEDLVLLKYRSFEASEEVRHE